MKKSTYIFLQEVLFLSIIIISVMILSLSFYALAQIGKQKPLEAVEDEHQIREMSEYHRSEGRTNILLF